MLFDSIKINLLGDCSRNRGRENQVAACRHSLFSYVRDQFSARPRIPKNSEIISYGIIEAGLCTQ